MAEHLPIAKLRIGSDVLRNLAEIAQMYEFKFRPDYELSFSANSSGAIWNFATFGPTAPEKRNFLNHELLQHVVEEYQVIKPEMGRFHIDQRGACWGLEKKNKIPFVTFEFDVSRSLGVEVLHSNFKRLDSARMLEKLAQQRQG